jgi:hypothetical protein
VSKLDRGLTPEDASSRLINKSKSASERAAPPATAAHRAQERQLPAQARCERENIDGKSAQTKAISAPLRSKPATPKTYVRPLDSQRVPLLNDDEIRLDAEDELKASKARLLRAQALAEESRKLLVEMTRERKGRPW